MVRKSMPAAEDGANLHHNFSYGAFGEGGRGAGAGYTGRWGGLVDARAGVLNWNRWVGPKIGRWISRDPIEIAGGPNSYSYARNNSVALVDWRGLKAKKCDQPPNKNESDYWECEQKVRKALGDLHASLNSAYSRGCEEISHGDVQGEWGTIQTYNRADRVGCMDSVFKFRTSAFYALYFAMTDRCKEGNDPFGGINAGMAFEGSYGRLSVSFSNGKSSVSWGAK